MGSDWNYSAAYDGSTDIGLNITSRHSELSYMYYVNLKLKGKYSTVGTFQSDFGVFGEGTIDDYGQADVGLVKNLRSFIYWSGTAYEPYPFSSAWFFDAAIGAQYGLGADSQYNAWAVRPGDVAALVPEPETYTILLAGLGLVGVVRRRKQKSSDQHPWALSH